MPPDAPSTPATRSTPATPSTPSTPSTLNLGVPESALVIVAHPDDAEFQCGGTLAKWSAAGATVHHLVLTDGSKGTWDPEVDQIQLVRRRRDEQQAAAAALGATGEIVMLEHVDGELSADTTTRGQVAAVLRRLRPQVVLGHDPWKRYRLHPDHHSAGRLAVDGIVAARDPFFHPEQLGPSVRPHRPDALLLFEADVVNHLEEVDPVALEAKLCALEAHESQLETTHFYKLDATDSRESALAGFRDRETEKMQRTGAAHGLGSSESFHLITDQL